MALSLAPGLGGNGFMVEDPKDLRVVLDKAMKYRGHALRRPPHLSRPCEELEGAPTQIMAEK